MPQKPPVALSIAGFDPSSGAGVTADLAVFAAHGIFGTSAITTLTVQSTLGVAAREEPSAAHLKYVLEHLNTDLPPAGVKIGALGNAALARVVADFLKKGEKIVPTIWDPALVSSSGLHLVDPSALSTLHDHLLPSIHWATPNWTELALLSGHPVATLADAEHAAAALGARYPNLWLAVTGGDQAQPTDLLRSPNGEIQHFPAKHIDSTSTHGTGCAFSSALLANLIHGHSPAEAVASAKHYVAEAIRQAPNLGSGRGPLALLWPLQKGTD
jgi:hydroxymethylpyrimidine/phosphomethylpyrimidine kinase